MIRGGGCRSSESGDRKEEVRLKGMHLHRVTGNITPPITHGLLKCCEFSTNQLAQLGICGRLLGTLYSCSVKTLPYFAPGTHVLQQDHDSKAPTEPQSIFQQPDALAASWPQGYVWLGAALCSWPWHSHMGAFFGDACDVDPFELYSMSTYYLLAHPSRVLLKGR